MSNVYEKYFGNRDYYDALADFLYDIKENKIPRDNVIMVVNELIKNKHISESSIFKREDKSKWNKEYLEYLTTGGSAGKLSKEYILYFVEVSNYVANKNKNIFIIIGAIIVIAIIATIAMRLK